MTRRIVWIAIALAALSGLAQAADHRDGPRIAQNTTTLGNIDINDVYIFRAPHGADRTAMIMTLSAAAGVVGPAHFLPGAVYEFRIDNTGDAVSDVIFQVVFSAPNNQGRQSYTVSLVSFSPMRHNGTIGHGTTSIGSDRSVRSAKLPGGGAVAAGLFDDPFFFDLIAYNKFIALADDGASLGARVAPFLPPNFPNNFFGNFNALGIVLEVPSAWLRANAKKPNISIWCRTLADVGDGRGFNQYDRMGIPAINTAVIQPGMPRGNPPVPPGGVVPTPDPSNPATLVTEDNFNLLLPENDPLLRPTASARIQFAYGVTPSYADGIAAFVLPDVLPFNTHSYGGFPNGRRLADDVIDAEFDLLTNGALTSDRVISDDVFRGSFPYLAPPLPRAATLTALQTFISAEPDLLSPSLLMDEHHDSISDPRSGASRLGGPGLRPLPGAEHSRRPAEVGAPPRRVDSHKGGAPARAPAHAPKRDREQHRKHQGLPLHD
jgi:hypothetical protein